MDPAHPKTQPTQSRPTGFGRVWKYSDWVSGYFWVRVGFGSFIYSSLNPIFFFSKKKKSLLQQRSLSASFTYLPSLNLTKHHSPRLHFKQTSFIWSPLSRSCRKASLTTTGIIAPHQEALLHTFFFYARSPRWVRKKGERADKPWGWVAWWA